MKKLLAIAFLMVINLSLAQSKYPLQTVFKGDSVVILTKLQADNINKTFDIQRNKLSNADYQLKTQSNKIDSLTALINAQSNQLKQLMALNNELTNLKDIIYWNAVDGAWMYYSYIDSSVKFSSLAYYHVNLNSEGDLLFINAPADCRVPDYIESQRNRKEQPPMHWEFRFPEAIRPKVFSIPLHK
jgi:hypothetical protein